MEDDWIRGFVDLEDRELDLLLDFLLGRSEEILKTPPLRNQVQALQSVADFERFQRSVRLEALSLGVTRARLRELLATVIPHYEGTHTSVLGSAQFVAQVEDGFAR